MILMNSAITSTASGREPIQQQLDDIHFVTNNGQSPFLGVEDTDFLDEVDGIDLEDKNLEEFNRDYGYDALADYRPSLPSPETPPTTNSVMGKVVRGLRNDEFEQNLKPKYSHELFKPRNSNKPKFELENDLNYHDSDHRHAHGHQSEKELLQLSRRMASTRYLSNIPAPPPPVWGRTRRGSHDDISTAQVQKRFIIDVEKTKREILQQEDTNGDCQITVQDSGPKVFKLGTANSDGFKKFEIRGTYMLSNLLQELAWATDHGRRFITIDLDRLTENPVARLHRLIKYHFWDGLTRRIDADGLEVICADPKNRQKDQQYRIYIPYHDTFALNYYSKVKEDRPHLNLDVVRLPEDITPKYVESLNTHPGILSLALRHHKDPLTNTEKVNGTPFVVPGGRFNEMYGWDSYFEALGLLVDGRIALAQGMVENFVYEIEHYGKILNANRSYYLTRSQPPFLTDMVINVYQAFLQDSAIRQPQSSNDALDGGPQRRSWAPGDLKVWLARCVRASMKELFGIWMASPRMDAATGLSTYHPEGIGIPPETESSHFHHVLLPHANANGMTVAEFENAYAAGTVKVPELDEYFVHDRAVRESGHDTTYRFDGNCANLATIDLNSLVYKYEIDLHRLLEQEFGGSFKFRVRRGKNDVHLNGFIDWMNGILENGVNGMIGENRGWESLWGRGLMVFDPDMDKEYHDWAIATSTSSNSNNIRLPSFDLGSTPSGTFTVTLPSQLFHLMAKRTKSQIHKYLWCPEDNLFTDYDCKLKRLSPYKTCTSLWALWCGLATEEQAKLMVPRALELFEVTGGLVAGTEESRGKISQDRPNRQWDFPYGWAPHQILAWEGLKQYGYDFESKRLCYRWLYMVVKAFVDFNGVVPEKFDVVGMTHLLDVEYGNVGTDFKFVVREGFGWMNASFQIGLTHLNTHMKRALGALMPPEKLFAAPNKPQ